MNKPTFKDLYYLCVQKLTNFPYIEENFDALTDYELLCKVVEELDKMIKNMKTQNESIIALYNAFSEIKTYVDTYFENLDVQEEINNKLDEMVEDGTLQEIISSYLETKAIFGFDTVADMKQATNLIKGSYARTLGYYEINDGGGATYKITDEESEEEYQEELESGLFATLMVDKYITPIMFGAVGNDINDDIIPLEKCLNFALEKHLTVYLLAKRYYISRPIDLLYPKDLYLKGTTGAWLGSSIIRSDTICLKWCGARNCTIEGVYFIGNTGIEFYDKDISSQDSRTYNCAIEKCIFNCVNSGIDVESLNGYMYIKHNTFRVKNRGIGLGVNYINQTTITAPNYFYIEENNFLNRSDVTTEKTKAIEVQYATYVFINKNDIVTKYGIDFSNMIKVCSNFRIINNSFFENEYMIKADNNSFVLRELLCVGNTFRLSDNTYGIDVSSSNNQLFNFTGNYFEVQNSNTNINNIIKFNSTSTYAHVFSNNTAPLLDIGVSTLCTFPTQIIRSISNYYSQFINLQPNASNTYTLGSKYSWIKNRYAACTNNNITLVTTQNENGSLSITATNNTDTVQNGIIFTAY